MKNTRKQRVRRHADAPGLETEPTIVPSGLVAFNELRRRGWVHVIGQSVSKARGRFKRRSRA